MPILDDASAIRKLLVSTRTVAVVGLSNKPARDSYIIASYLLEKGYTVIPVNPNIASVFGLRLFPSLEAVPVGIDLVDVFRRTEAVPEVAISAIRVQAKGLWLQTGVIHEAATQKASDAGLLVVMDRCIRVAHSILVR